ncbi:MAG: lipid ABC transporter permease/ATP-binding protein, partial [Candidatus Accumulibacter sp.]|nr:lipid ABC transporter permease/ATP-binding protein [Accumulibacter sp.]
MQHSAKPPVSSLKIYFRLLRYLRPFIGLFAISLLGFIVFASAHPMQASILKFFVDGLTEPEKSTFHGIPLFGDLDLAYGVPLLLVMIVFWQGVGSYFGNYFLSRVSLGLIHDLRVALFENLLRLPNAYFDRNNSGHLISRITYNVTMVTGAATDAIKVV